mmetsp:Transcript_40945/g.95651  ORF Transcript_40945/g.95651 Transcript_40945/m.95651 type:complete len:81 (+) Transcript_40945:1002-1244(+)
MARAKALSPVSTLNDLYRVLGDTQNKDYPIYAAPGIFNADNRTTLNTVVLELSELRGTVYRSNPMLRHAVDTFTLPASRS